MPGPAEPAAPGYFDEPTRRLLGELAAYQPVASELPRLREILRGILQEHGHVELADPVELSSGQHSRHFLDAKRALAQGSRLVLAGRAVLALAADHDLDFAAVGGPTLGADHISHAVAVLANRRWFTVRNQRKGRGTDRLVEGSALETGTPVLLVDEVTSTGASLRAAWRAVRDAGAQVVLATALVDRGESAGDFFEKRGVAYEPLLTYRDFGFDPVTTVDAAGQEDPDAG